MPIEKNEKYVALNNKSDLRTYVHDMAEIEIKRQIIDIVADRSKALAISIKNKAEQDLSDVSEKLRSEKQKYEKNKHIKNKEETSLKETKKTIVTFHRVFSYIVESLFKTSWKFRLFIYFLCLIPGALLAGINNEYIKSELLDEIFFPFGMLFIMLVLAETFFISKIIKKLRIDYVTLYKINKLDFDCSVRELNITEKKIEELEKELERKKNNLKVQTNKARTLEYRSSVFKKESKKMAKILEQSYEQTGVVPIDYRYISCVLMIDYVFKNDLADTVREAIEYYETKVFRDGLFNKLDDIHNTLKIMSGKLSSMTSILRSINSQVGELSEDVCNISENSNLIAGGMAESVVLQEKTFAETKAMRYATEAVASSCEYALKYGIRTITL